MAVAIGAVVVVFAIAFVVAGYSLFAGGDTGDGGQGGGAPAGSRRTTTSTSSPPATTLSTAAPDTASATAAVLDVTRRYAVGTRTLTFVDTARTTSVRDTGTPILHVMETGDVAAQPSVATIER